MKKGDQKELPHHSQFLQKAADRMCADLPDRLLVSLTDVAIWYSWRAWSPALFRTQHSGAVVLEPVARMLVQIPDPKDWDDVACGIMEDHFREEIADQIARHASARMLGLVHEDGRCDDLEGDRMQIDRTLLRILGERQIDVRAAAAAVAAADDRVEDFVEEILLTHEDHHFTVTHNGVGPPTISTWQPLGSAYFNGMALTIELPLPQTIATAAIGGPLGVLVDTGCPELNARLIGRTHIDELTHLLAPSDLPRVRIVLNSDMTTLREAGPLC